MFGALPVSSPNVSVDFEFSRMSMSPDFSNGLHSMEAAAALLLDTLQVKPLPVPEGLALLESDVHGHPVSMRSAAWFTPTFRLIRQTVLYSPDRIHSFNFVLYPSHRFDAPVFATDFLLTGPRLRIAVIDAMPLFPEEENYAEWWVEPFAPLYEKSLELAPVYERKLSWSTRYLGPHACLATGLAAAEAGPVCQLWWEYLSLYLSLIQDAHPADATRTAKVQAWHREYNKAHLAVESERNPFMYYFGKETGMRYNREFLFSDAYGRESGY